MLRCTLSLDCIDAFNCIVTAMGAHDESTPEGATDREYWINESRAYDLDTVGTNPYGLTPNPVFEAYVN